MTPTKYKHHYKSPFIVTDIGSEPTTVESQFKNDDL
jgi:hypothetical protein